MDEEQMKKKHLQVNLTRICKDTSLIKQMKSIKKGLVIARSKKRRTNEEEMKKKYLQVILTRIFEETAVLNKCNK
jgi:hypothetical protein